MMYVFSSLTNRGAVDGVGEGGFVHSPDGGAISSNDPAFSVTLRTPSLLSVVLSSFFL